MGTWGRSGIRAVAVLASFALFMLSVAGTSYQRLPSTQLELAFEGEIKAEGDALAAMEPEARALLESSHEFSFEVPGQWAASAMVMKPKPEYRRDVDAWVDGIAHGIRGVAEEAGIEPKTRQFQLLDGRAEELTLNMEEASERLHLRFVILADAENVIVLAWSAPTGQKESIAAIDAQVNQLRYAGVNLSSPASRKPASPSTPSQRSPDSP